MLRAYGRITPTPAALPESRHNSPLQTLGRPADSAHAAPAPPTPFRSPLDLPPARSSCAELQVGPAGIPAAWLHSVQSCRAKAHIPQLLVPLLFLFLRSYAACFSDIFAHSLRSRRPHQEAPLQFQGICVARSQSVRR